MATQTTITRLAPAKINRFLYITGQRDDGYHTLQTLIQFIDLYDELSFTLTPSPDIYVTSSAVELNHTDNLVYRAATLLQKHSQCPHGANIILNKQLPMGAGLGGGSSDAATTLIALNELWELHLPQTKLCELAIQLGADVPVCIAGSSSFVTGIGEHLEPVSRPSEHLVLLIPDCHVSTAKMFQDPDLPRTTAARELDELMVSAWDNDFTNLARRDYPAIDEAISWLEHHTTAHLSGSGCAVFGIVADRARAEELTQLAPCRAHAAQTLSSDKNMR